MKNKNRNRNKTELYNPMQDFMMGNMPGLPAIIQNSMPVELPRASFKQGTIDLFFGNIKRNQLVKAAKAEADLARYSKEAVLDKLEVVQALMTCSAKMADAFGQYEHNKVMRRMAEDEGRGKVVLLNLEAEEKKAKIQQINYQTALIAQEVELSKIETQIKAKQLKDILGEAA